MNVLDHAFDAVQTGLALIGTAGMIVRANPACAGILGRQDEDLVGLDLLAIVHPEDLTSALGELEHLLRDGRAGPIVARLAHPTEEWVWVRANAALLPRDPPLGFLVIEDVTAEQHAVEAMHRAEAESAQRMAQQAAVAALGRTALSGTTPGVIAQRATDLVVETLGVRFAAVLYDDGHPDGLLQVAGTGPFEDATGVFRRRRDESWVALLRSRAPLVVGDVRDLPTELDRDLLAQAGLRSFVSSPILSRRVAPGALLAASDDPDGFSTQDTTFLEAMANVLAGSLDAHSWMDELRHQALHDTLTGLPNRALLLERLDLALHRSARGGTDVAVLVCDLDRFKVVNDGLGHAAGDVVLRTVAERLTKHVRPGDTVGRFGGDEFVIVCPHMAERHEVERIAQRLAGAFEEPIVVVGTRLVITASIGISLGHVAAPGAAADLLRDADAAMYRAKSDGRSRFELFDEDMRQRASRRLIVETELRRALDNEEMVPHYQPIISLRDHRPVGVEALARWNHPSGDVVGPIEFLTVGRDAGLLPAVGRRILEVVASDVARWMALPGWVPHWTAFNLAPSEIADPSLLARLDDVVARTGADPKLLRIEVTEESLLEDTVQVGGVLDALRGRGLGISVDDFGTGYSSLAYLKRLPVDALKLDREFVHGLGEDDDDTAIASAVVQMGHALRLQVVAEGVETEQQLEVLRSMGCDLAQGYLIARPMPAAELETWLGAAVTD